MKEKLLLLPSALSDAYIDRVVHRAMVKTDREKPKPVRIKKSGKQELMQRMGLTANFEVADVLVLTTAVVTDTAKGLKPAEGPPGIKAGGIC